MAKKTPGVGDRIVYQSVDESHSRNGDQADVIGLGEQDSVIIIQFDDREFLEVDPDECTLVSEMQLAPGHHRVDPNIRKRHAFKNADIMGKAD